MRSLAHFHPPENSEEPSFGYDDNQSLSVTFSDGGSLGDSHNYRTVLSGSETISLTGPLTGAWAPDGRTADPATVLASDPRTALLSGFNGVVSQGDWRLFVADLTGGSVHQLNRWTLTLDFTPVPETEPSTYAAGLALLALVGAPWWRRRATWSQAPRVFAASASSRRRLRRSPPRRWLRRADLLRRHVVPHELAPELAPELGERQQPSFARAGGHLFSSWLAARFGLSKPGGARLPPSGSGVWLGRNLAPPRATSTMKRGAPVHGHGSFRLAAGPVALR